MVGAKQRLVTGGWKDTAAAWLFGQEFNNVLLTLILASLLAMGWFGIPALISQIQDGYAVLDARQREERKALEDRCQQHFNGLVELIRTKNQGQ